LHRISEINIEGQFHNYFRITATQLEKLLRTIELQKLKILNDKNKKVKNFKKLNI